MGKRTKQLRYEFTPIKKQMLKTHHICEECGAGGPLEVHHKLPLVLGGTNDIDNLVVVCANCHAKNHAYDKSTLTKAGIEETKRDNEEAKKKAFSREWTKLVSYEELEMKMIQLSEDVGNKLSIREVFDVIDSLEFYGTKETAPKTADKLERFWRAHTVDMYEIQGDAQLTFAEGECGNTKQL